MEDVEYLSCAIAEGVADIRVSRPKRRNAFTDDMYRGLAGWLLDLDKNPAVRCIVIRGSNGIFTSGSDVSCFLDRTSLERERHFQLVADLTTAPSRIGKPVIAAVQGFALGGGTGLTAACDLAIAEEGAVFGLPEIKVGFWPCTISPAVARAIGPRKAFEMALLGERFDAHQAETLGLVSKVVAAAEFENEVAAVARKIAAFSSVAVQMGKRAFQQSLDIEFDKAVRFMGRAMALASATDDAGEGITAFLEKRQPQWKDQ
jgi:enoyl-CoA hydratase